MSVELAPRSRDSHGIYVLVFLLLVNLTLLSVQVEDPQGGMLLKEWVLTAGAPFIGFSAAVSRAVREAWVNYVWLRGAREENARYRQAVQQLSLQARSLEQIRGENLRLRELLGFKEGHRFDTLGARVVGRTPDFLSRVVYLDRGAADGVQPDFPVVTAAGIVGRVVLMTRHTSQVQLISNADASVGILIERTSHPGVLRGSGGRRLSVDYIGSTEDVVVGDVVLTSGLDGVFPRGLVVGRVTESVKGKTVFREIQVEPAADLLRLTQVLILLRHGEAGGSNDPSAPGGAEGPVRAGPAGVPSP